MDFQICCRTDREVQVGVDDHLVATFERKGFFVQNLHGKVDGLTYDLKLPAPWTGNSYQVRQGDHELARSKRPRIRRGLIELELVVQARPLRLVSDDEFHLRFAIVEGPKEAPVELGDIVQREFGAQDKWTADLHAPEGWSAPLAAFVGWITKQARQSHDR